MVGLGPLDRKLVRDLWRLRWQVGAIALLIACGVSVSVMAYSAQSALGQAQERFYAGSRFADVFATARTAPRSRLAQIAEIPGVLAVDGRIVEAGLMAVPALSRPATARIISLPDPGRPGLNLTRLTRGRMPAAGSTNEVVALQSFLDAAHVSLGERLTAVIRGRAFSFVVVGAVVSPEFVYVPAPQSFMPDDAHQGVFWAPRPAVERAAGQVGAFNDVALDLAPGASGPAVLAAVDRLLEPYGGNPAQLREDQASHVFLAAELEELSRSASILPPVFFLVALALVHLVISRLVETEREQIGLLKAFGYTDASAGLPYLKLGAIIGSAGVVAGGLAGAGLGAAMVELYREYFRFPELAAAFHWPAFLITGVIATGATIAGAWDAFRQAAALSPAVAMQAARPSRYRKGPLDALLRTSGVDEGSRMIVRGLERFPLRAGLACLGLAAGLSLLVGTQFLFNSLEEVLQQTYYRSQRWGEAVAFAEAREISAIAAVARLPGVTAAEPVRAVGVRISANGLSELTQLIGLESGGRLQSPLDGAGRPLSPLGSGVVLSEALAAQLGLRAGEPVTIEVLGGPERRETTVVMALARDYSGFAAYATRRHVNGLMQEGDVASGAQLLVAADARPAFYRSLESIPQIVAATSREDMIAAWRSALQESFRVAILFYIGFAAAIAFGVAYNTCRITLSERARDLATLRVLGFGHWACAYILAGELAVLTLLAIPLGLAGGQGLVHILVAAYSRDEIRLPVVIGLQSYGAATVLYLCAVALAAVLVIQRVWSLDLVAVLKTRE